MTHKKANYVLESSAETERLEKQSRMKTFDFENELQYLEIQDGQKILDAGCGSGIVSDYLSKRAKNVKVVGVDFSKDRIEQAKAQYESENVSFSQANLLEFNGENERFDIIVCRYVLRHFSLEDSKKVLQNLFRALKPGGRICCVDVEGVMGDVYPASEFMQESLKKLRDGKAIDFYVARKMPALLLEQNFQNIDWHALVSELKGEELAQEADNLEQSFKNAKAFIEHSLGGSEQCERFQAEYLSALRAPFSPVLFYNRVIALATKPIQGPRLVQVKK